MNIKLLIIFSIICMFNQAKKTEKSDNFLDKTELGENLVEKTIWERVGWVFFVFDEEKGENTNSDSFELTWIDNADDPESNTEEENTTNTEEENESNTEEENESNTEEENESNTEEENESNTEEENESNTEEENTTNTEEENESNTEEENESIPSYYSKHIGYWMYRGYKKPISA